MLTTKRTLIVMVLMALTLSATSVRIASASPSQQSSTEPAPFGLLFAVLVDARDRGILQDKVTSLFSDLFIEYLILPGTGETPGQVRQRLATNGQSAFDFLAEVLVDAYQEGSLSSEVSGLFSDLFIEYLMLPATGETPGQVKGRLNADYFVNRGQRHFDIGEWELAIESYTVAIYLHPSNAMYRQRRGWVHRHIGENVKAIEDFTEAIRLDPDMASFYIDRATAFHRMGNYYRALEDSDKAIELQPDYAPFYRDRGYLHFRLDNYDGAIEDYTKAIKLEPGNAGFYVDRAWVYLESGDHYLAIADFDKAIELDPDNEWLRQNRPHSAPFPSSAPIRGISGDLWADVILGKPDFSEIATNRVVPFKLFNPGGILVDRSSNPGKAYIWDSGNSRVLGLDLAQCYEGPGPCVARLVIGQPSPYDHSACNGDSGLQNYPLRPKARADTLCGISSTAISPGEEHTFVTMAINSQGDIFVPDSHNHRLLKYDSPFENDSTADTVWGQPDFTGNLCNMGRPQPGPETLCFHSGTNRLMLNRYGNGADLDAEGNLWVADGGNNRVLRFPYDPESGEILKVADLVLGQPDFYTAAPGDSLDRFHAPSAVKLDTQGKLYVADTVNDRVLIFAPPFRVGMVAGSTFGSHFHEPTSLEIDPLNRGIWVNDSGNHMVELWNLEGNTVLKVLGKESYTPDRMCGETSQTSWEDGSGICESAGSIAIDAQGNVLVPAFLGISDLFRYPSNTFNPGNNAPARPDKRLFYPPAGANFTSPVNIHSSRGVVVWQDQIIVSDIERLLFWNRLDSLTSGQSPDGVIGSKYEESYWPYCCGRIKADEAGRLWVLGFEGRYFIDVYQLPLTDYSVPIRTIWLDGQTFSVLGTDDEISLEDRIFGIAPSDSGEFLWLSDTDNHRVLRIRDPLTEPVVDVILGQSGHAGVKCNRIAPLRAHEPDTEGALLNPQPDTLCLPGALSIDRLGNLYVSDHSLEEDGNHRLLIFHAGTLPATNSAAIFGPAAAKIFTRSAGGVSNFWADRWETDIRVPYRNIDMSAATWEPAFDSSNRMVVGYNSYLAGRFVGVYDDPLGEETLPTSYLYDFSSMPYTAAFDDDDNLYVGDINRGRVLVYHNPFNNPPRQEVATTTAAVPSMPEYTVTIYSANPEPPQCVIATSSGASENTLRFGVEGISEIRDMDFMLQFRRVTGLRRLWLYPDSDAVRLDAIGLNIDMSRADNPWRDHGKATLTLQITDHDGVPLSNWSSAFILAEDKESCERESPVPGLIPSNAQAANAHFENFVPYTPHPSLYEEYRHRTQSPSTPPQNR
ncbi:MAG: tetratricopeptide repeat protein [Dehalococcoidia bacterium]|nr:tetratricopeptide repeat protein [Dehalococcoidia bacterium]